MDRIVELSKEIDECQEQIETISREMESAKKEFLVELENFIKIWYRDLIDYSIIGNAGNTKKLGGEKLKCLKEDVANLLKDIPNLTSKYAIDNEVWIHENFELDNNEYMAKTETLELIYNIKKSFSVLVVAFYTDVKKLLELYNYHTLSVKSGVLYKDIVYPINRSMRPWIPDELEESINNYEGLLEDLVKEINLLEKIKEKKAQAEAKLLWEEA